jgi:hypothetical protein
VLDEDDSRGGTNLVIEIDQKKESTMDNQKPLDQKKDSFTHKVGDKVERFGEKISNAGAPKTGKVIYDAGNKIEHMNDDKTK